MGTAVPTDAETASPLAAHLGLSSHQNFDTAFAALDTRMVDEGVRACMIDQGFEYKVRIEAAPKVWFMDNLPPEQHATTYGFALSTVFEVMLFETAIPDPSEDPNQAHLQAMTPGERTAWYIAYRGEELQRDSLTGQPIDPATGEPFDETDGPYHGGCLGDAVTATRGALSELTPKLDELDERVAADPRTIDLHENWSSCMNDRGYAFESQEEMYGRVYEDFVGLRQRIMSELSRLEARPTELPRPQQEQLDTFKRDEIAMAIASFDCDDLAAHRQIRQEYETLLIDQIPDVLESLRSEGT